MQRNNKLLVLFWYACCERIRPWMRRIYSSSTSQCCQLGFERFFQILRKFGISCDGEESTVSESFLIRMPHEFDDSVIVLFCTVRESLGYDVLRRNTHPNKVKGLSSVWILIITCGFCCISRFCKLCQFLKVLWNWPCVQENNKVLFFATLAQEVGIFYSKTSQSFLIASKVSIYTTNFCVKSTEMCWTTWLYPKSNISLFSENNALIVSLWWRVIFTI